MEGTGLSKLLDGVLIDSISDFEAFNELKRDVDHQLIQAAPEQRAYLVDYIQEGIEMQIIDSEDGQTYQKYLKALDKNPSARVPELRNLDDRLGMKGEMKHPSALKAAELFHTLNKLHLKRQANLFSSMTKLVSHRWDWHLSDLRIKHDLEIKRLQCSRLVSQLRRAMAVNLDNTVANWRINSQPPVLAALSPPAPEPPRQRETIKPRDHFYEEYFEEDVEESEYMRKRLMHKRSLKDYEKRDRQYKYVIKLIGLCSVRFEQLAYWRWRLVYEKEKLRRDKLKEAFGLAELIAKTHTKKAYFDSWIENMKELPVKETRFSAVYTLMQRMSRTTRSSMINWKVNASTSSFKDEINRIRSKSLGILKKVPRRTQKDAVDSLAGSKKEYIRALRVFMKSFQSTTQSAFSKWQRKTVPTKTVTKITEVEADPKITHDYRPNLLSCYLERVPRSNLRFALSRFFKESGVKTTLALHRLTEYSTRKPRSAMTSWKSHMLAVQERKLLDSSRSFRLSNLLKKLIHTNLQKSYDRARQLACKIMCWLAHSSDEALTRICEAKGFSPCGGVVVLNNIPRCLQNDRGLVGALMKKRGSQRFFWCYPSLSDAAYRRIIENPEEFIDPLEYLIGIPPKCADAKPFINTSLSFVDEFEPNFVHDAPKMNYCPSPTLDLNLTIQTRSVSPRSFNFTGRRPVLRKAQKQLENKENKSLY
mmetsp:Transcript_34157/g.59669  ORF Transcript_34157/g.59669 Transcript_34157/m.59669 type:complete len:704 (+) Transcript_34157:18-2129(+)